MENPILNKINTQPSPFQSNDQTPTQQQSSPNPLQQQLQQSIKQQYQVLVKLGSGAYGHVWKVKDKKTQETFALKKVFSAFQNDVDAQRTYRQIVYLNKLSKHQNVVKLKKVIKAQNDIDLYLLFQYMESDLFYAIKEDLLNQLHKKYIIYQIAKCLRYVHSAGLLHRDIKPSNILINPNCQVRLCDFGLSRTLWRYNQQQPKLTQFIATRWYRAPQVLFGSQYYGTKSDMWSVGCLIYELYARRPLLPGNDTVQQIQKVLEFKGFPNIEQKKSFRIPKIDQILGLFDLEKKPLNDYFKYLPSEQVKQILIHLLQYNPQKRWSAIDLLNCSFLQQFRQFQSEIQADKQIKTGINDHQRKSVQTYRNTIYNTFVYDSTKRCQDIKQKLQIFRQNKQSTYRPSLKKFTTRDRPSELLTQKRNERSIMKSNSSASMHTSKGNKNKISNTQRISHRKNFSSHSVSKLENDLFKAYKVTPQKPLLTQLKSKKYAPKYEHSTFTNRNSNHITKRQTNSFSKQKQAKQADSQFKYPTYLRSSAHNSASKIPKMIQQKIYQQRNAFNKLNVQNSQTSKILRHSLSKQKKSPYVNQLQQKGIKMYPSSFSSNLASRNISIHTQNSNLKQNNSNLVSASTAGPRKLKRKGIVN